METLLKLPALCFFIARAISPHYTRKLLNRALHYTLPKPCMVTTGQESQEPPQESASMATSVHDTTSTFPWWDRHAEDEREARFSEEYTYV